MTGKEVGTIELPEAVYGADVNEPVLHSVVRAYLMNQRQGTQSALTRTEVSGGGRKPWRQKGTGRARQGSTRSPQWTHGGIVFAPKPRDYRQHINKKVKRVAAVSALSSKVRDNEIIVLDAIKADDYKTKVMVQMLAAVGAGKKTLVVLTDADDKVRRSLSNIPNVRSINVSVVSVYDILDCDTFLIVKSAAEKLGEVYA
jgi:large subunit ribosomal protein L4